MIIETKVYTYRKCQSEDLVKNGTNASGSSQYHCKAYGAYGVLERKERATEEKKELIINVYRTENTCRILWDRVPSAYKEAIVFSDYWGAYQAAIPSEQQRPVGKETGETAYIERWNNTLRQQLTRFLRKTLSFSKCVKIHKICLKLFIHRYNTELLSIVG